MGIFTPKGTNIEERITSFLALLLYVTEEELHLQLDLKIFKVAPLSPCIFVNLKPAYAILLDFSFGNFTCAILLEFRSKIEFWKATGTFPPPNTLSTTASSKASVLL